MMEISEYKEGQILECIDDSKFDSDFYTKGSRYTIMEVDPFGKELLLTANDGSNDHPFDDRRLLYKGFKIVES